MLISDPVQIAIIGSITTLLSGNLIVSLKNSIKHDKADVKLDNIKTLTDGTITALRIELGAALTRISDLEKMVTLSMEAKTEFEKEYIRRRKEELEAKLIETMHENTNIKIELTKAKLSPALRPEDL